MPLYKCKLVVGYEGYNGYDKEATWEATIEASDDLEVRALANKLCKEYMGANFQWLKSQSYIKMND